MRQNRERESVRDREREREREKERERYPHLTKHPRLHKSPPSILHTTAHHTIQHHNTPKYTQHQPSTTYPHTHTHTHARLTRALMRKEPHTEPIRAIVEELPIPHVRTSVGNNSPECRKMI